jgi:hypothetical protein
MNSYHNVSGFVSTNRANPLAQKIVAADIALGLNDQLTFYTADNCESPPQLHSVNLGLVHQAE